MYMTHEAFEPLVAAALDALPEFFLEKLSNVDVVVEDRPDEETMRLAGVQRPSQLLGFYHGVPQTVRTRHYGLVLPDKISIYRRSITVLCRTPEEVQALVSRVVRHEIAHHFGISDERLHELGAY